MAKIVPFKGCMYNTDTFGRNISDVVAPPYDVISDSVREELNNKNDANIVQIILGKELEEDNDSVNKYTRARDLFVDWINKNILVEDESSHFYIYSQEYTALGERRTRIGFFGVMQIEEPGEKEVLPHEKTHSKAIVDRMHLIKTVNANLSPVFSLFSDDSHGITNMLKEEMKNTEPYLQAEYAGEKHTFYKLEDRDKAEFITEKLKDKKVFIADGHHRYEVAKAYRDLCRKDVPGYNGFADHVMMFFCDMDDETNITVLATHRIIKDTSGLTMDDIKAKLSDHFNCIEAANLEEAESLILENIEKKAFGYTDGSKYCVFVMKGLEIVDRIVNKDMSEDWKNLDVSILHSGILDGLLGVDQKEGNILYSRDSKETDEMVRQGDCDGAFFLNPTPPGALKSVAEKGEVMPQKSTYFYPKLLTGLVVNKFKV